MDDSGLLWLSVYIGDRDLKESTRNPVLEGREKMSVMILLMTKHNRKKERKGRKKGKKEGCIRV